MTPPLIPLPGPSFIIGVVTEFYRFLWSPPPLETPLISLLTSFFTSLHQVIRRPHNQVSDLFPPVGHLNVSDPGPHQCIVVFPLVPVRIRTLIYCFLLPSWLVFYRILVFASVTLLRGVPRFFFQTPGFQIFTLF